MFSKVLFIFCSPSSLEDLSPEKDENSPTSAFAKIDKPRSNPFKGDLASVKRNTSNVAYRDVVTDRGQNLQSGNRSPRRSRIPETSALAASTPGSINDDHTDRYEYIPPIPNLMKLVKLILFKILAAEQISTFYSKM